MAEDEYQLYRAIANEEVYIPRRRLKAVDPSCSTSDSPFNTGMNLSTGPYREEGELIFEDIDEELYDLLSKILIKDPAERFKLREVKRHRGWLEASDPSRGTASKRIQVDSREMERAVIPITLLSRARSAVKTVVGKVMGVKALAGEL
ncbi:hypothetical protein DL95DRAFT_389308 [Leptodontidium sp. 2 PMI_412]|nr:hypothetical protein DL95DRAFT_389308 [Leptodontidium sp. 2 PMI_412]